jgi:hypothetical protein
MSPRTWKFLGTGLATVEDAPPVSVFEHLADQVVFRALAVVTYVIFVPVVVVGAVIGVPFLIAVLAAEPDVWALAVLALIGAGVTGLVGIVRSRRHTIASEGRSIETTEVMLLVGTVAAACVAAVAAIQIAGALGRGRSVEPFVAWVAVLFSIAAVDGAGRIARLLRMRARRTGRSGAGLPLLWLGMAMAQAACVLIVMAGGY